MTKNQSLVLLTKGEKNRQVLSGQLNDLLRGKVQVRSLNIEEKFSPSLLEGDLIVVASMAIRRDLKHLLAGRPNVLVARRTIDLRGIHKLLRLPRRTKAMLVNDRKETAEEAISLLYGMGFNDFWFIPFYPGQDNIPEVEVAVTPGEPQLIPKNVKQVIDLGCRIIDVTTLTEILFRLDLLDEQANLLSARYLNQAIDISKKLVQSSNENQELNQLLTTVLNKVHDGVIAIDSAGKALVYNRSAEKFFKLPARQVIGRPLKEMIPQIAAERPLQQLKSEEDTAELYGDHKVLVRRTLLEDEKKQPKGVVVTFSDLGTLEKMERRLKAHPGNTGYVAKYTFNDIKGKSPAILGCLEKARYFAETDLTILINGPTGAGKELLAHAIHNASPRHLNPFVAINCTALPKDLLESELFGFEEGAFTGARRGGRAGLFEQANGGTIFLDEIGDLPLNLQAKLLRVLEEKEVMRIGAERIIPIDVRVVAATNRDLKQAVERGDFRQDLYYRLNTIMVRLPSLRERSEDIYLLFEHFLNKWGRKPEDFFTPRVLDALLGYSWPGNIRELRNVIDYMATICRGRKAGMEDLPPDLQQENPPLPVAAPENSVLLELGEIIGAKQFSADLAVLRAIAGNQSMGRQRLVEELKQQGYTLTEDMVRTRLKNLARSGLVKIGAGRQGTSITVKGRQLLAKWTGAGTVNSLS
ncbi:MAG: sigma 54-interacting transcriptional regulator [Bacillota bacterium]